MIVVDASAILELLLRTPLAATVEARLFDEEEALATPHLLDLEVAQVLRRYGRRGELSDARALQTLNDLADLRIERYPHTAFLSRIWQLRHNLSAYDAAYVALAEASDACLLTCDKRIAGAPSTNARIEVLEPQPNQ